MKKADERTLTLIETTENSDVLSEYINSIANKHQLEFLDLVIGSADSFYHLMMSEGPVRSSFTRIESLGDIGIEYTIANVHDMYLINEAPGKLEIIVTFKKDGNTVFIVEGSGPKMHGCISTEWRDFMDIFKEEIKTKRKTFKFWFKLFGPKDDQIDENDDDLYDDKPI